MRFLEKACQTYRRLQLHFFMCDDLDMTMISQGRRRARGACSRLRGACRGPRKDRRWRHELRQFPRTELDEDFNHGYTPMDTDGIGDEARCRRTEARGRMPEGGLRKEQGQGSTEPLGRRRLCG